MYKCIECKVEYKDRPDYCECGNNTFEELLAQSLPKKKVEKSSLKEKKPIDKGNLVSFLILGLSLVLSICVWMFLWNVKPSSNVSHKKDTFTKKTPKNMPNIDKIWDDTPIYQPKTQIVDPQPIVSVENYIQEPPYMKELQQPRQLSEQPKPVNKTEAKLPIIPKATQSAISKPIINEEPKKIEKPVSDLNSPEFIQYKNALRAALFSKFAVGSVSGSGTCTVQFTINKNGKLENRAFAQKSDNKALNDTVYYMLMSVPQYYPPPASYNGETLHLKFIINNGNYEISYT